MKFAKIPVASADRIQLKQYAELSLGLSVAHNIKTEDLRAEVVKAIAPQTEIEVVAAAAPADMERPAPSTEPHEVDLVAPTDEAAPAAAVPPIADPKDLNETTMVTVIIHESERPGGKEPVFLQVNGRAIWVERAKPQTIKLKYVLVLQNALETIYEQTSDKEIVSRVVPAYPFQIVQQPARAA